MLSQACDVRRSRGQGEAKVLDGDKDVVIQAVFESSALNTDLSTQILVESSVGSGRPKNVSATALCNGTSAHLTFQEVMLPGQTRGRSQARRRLMQAEP